MKYIKLKDLSYPKKGYYGISASACSYKNELPQYLRITDIDEYGNIPYKLPTSIDIFKYRRWNEYLLKKNDIVFARTGSSGRNHFVENLDKETVFAGFLIKFSIDPKLVIPKYIKYYCQSEKYWNNVKSKFSGTIMPNVNAKQYEELLIPIVDRKIQQHIVNTILILLLKFL